MMVVGAKQFHGAFHNDVEKVRQIAFPEKRHVLRKTLKKRRSHEFVGIRLSHVTEERQRADQFPVGVAHTGLQPPSGVFEIYIAQAPVGLIIINLKNY
jgi:hypothetical protein